MSSSNADVSILFCHNNYSVYVKAFCQDARAIFSNNILVSHVMLDLGFSEGGYWYSIACPKIYDHAHFLSFWRETSYSTCQSVFDQDLCKGMLR